MELSLFEDLFSENTKKINLISQSIDLLITTDEFDTKCKSIGELVVSSYESAYEDIEDLGDIIVCVDNLIKKLWIDKENFFKFIKLSSLRIQIKKLAHKKFREGYDYIYKDMIKSGHKKHKIKYLDEVPRKFANVEECETQYHELVKFVWEPSVLDMKEIIGRLCISYDFVDTKN